MPTATQASPSDPPPHGGSPVAHPFPILLCCLPYPLLPPHQSHSPISGPTAPLLSPGSAPMLGFGFVAQDQPPHRCFTGVWGLLCFVLFCFSFFFSLFFFFFLFPSSTAFHSCTGEEACRYRGLAAPSKQCRRYHLEQWSSRTKLVLHLDPLGVNHVPFFILYPYKPKFTPCDALRFSPFIVSSPPTASIQRRGRCVSGGS